MKKSIAMGRQWQNWVQRQWDSIFKIWRVCGGLYEIERRHITKIVLSVQWSFHRAQWWGMHVSLRCWALMDGTVNAENHKSILQTNFISSIPKLWYNGKYIFKYDGASPNSAKMTNEWLRENCIDVLDRLSSSLDLGSLENLWAIMKGPTAYSVWT